jgi:hypothetical protein
MWKSFWGLTGNQPVGTLEAQFYDSGEDDKYYVTASFSSESNPNFHFVILLPLLYESQLIVLVDPYAKYLADNLVSLITQYKNGSPLSLLLPTNTPIPNAPLVLSSKTVLLKKKSRDEYFTNFFPEFEVSGNKDAIVAKFLWALLPWAFSQLEDDDLRVFVLAHLDLVSSVLSKGLRTRSNSPLLRSDAGELISRLGWTLPDISSGRTSETLSRKTKPQAETPKQLEFWFKQFEAHVKQALAYFSEATSEQPPDLFDQNRNIINEKQLVQCKLSK